MSKELPISDDEVMVATKHLCNLLGTYKLLRVIEAVSTETAKGMHPDAVINRDLPVLREAINTMQGNHMLRCMDEPV